MSNMRMGVKSNVKMGVCQMIGWARVQYEEYGCALITCKSDRASPCACASSHIHRQGLGPGVIASGPEPGPGPGLEPGLEIVFFFDDVVVVGCTLPFLCKSWFWLWLWFWLWVVVTVAMALIARPRDATPLLRGEIEVEIEVEVEKVVETDGQGVKEI